MVGLLNIHDDVIQWKHFLRYWPFNSPVTDEFPAQRPVMRSLNVSCDLRLNKLLHKQSRRRWFETPSRSFWRHCKFLSRFRSMYRERVGRFGKRQASTGFIRGLISYLQNSKVTGAHGRPILFYDLFFRHRLLMVNYLCGYTRKYSAFFKIFRWTFS